MSEPIEWDDEEEGWVDVWFDDDDDGEPLGDPEEPDGAHL